ncbi:hypothetical protein PENSPDRAFT_739415 [Peniophora sp. CONT]|nr:hypothetical protein PENSPDRAFT_739415 [Peniophora sp. CONT]
MEAIKPASEVKGDDEDFSSSWDLPTTSSKLTPATSPKHTGPPVIGCSASTVSSASLRSSSAGSNARPAKLGAGRLGFISTTPETTTTGGGAVKKGKLGGLGAKKAGPVDFAEAERKAQEEAERIKQLGNSSFTGMYAPDVGPMPEVLGQVLNASSTSLSFFWGSGQSQTEEERRGYWSGCTWRDCQRYCKEVAGVKLSTCKGCGQIQSCGRECQRSDWIDGEHKARCRRLR